jgi:hypothetical protein
MLAEAFRLRGFRRVAGKPGMNAAGCLWQNRMPHIYGTIGAMKNFHVPLSYDRN